MAKVIMPFRDRVTWVAYGVGDEYEGTPERLAELCGLGMLAPADGGIIESGLIANGLSESVSGGATEPHGGNLEGLTVVELRKLADERGIHVPSRATKAKLLEILGA